MTPGSTSRRETPSRLDQWGTTYVAARAPLRGNERHHWRIFAGAAEVSIDGVGIGVYAPIDATFELADVPVPAGRHVITSADPFGLVQVGYTESASNPTCQVNTQEDVCFSSYAYAGGLAIVPP